MRIRKDAEIKARVDGRTKKCQNPDYDKFLLSKSQFGCGQGFKDVSLPDFLFDFQKSLTEWALRRGRAAMFADCGLGKTPMELVWADNVTRKTGKPVLILTPLAVAHQFVREGEKFGIETHHSRDGKITNNIVVTNYERLHYFDCSSFSGVVCDESSILKNFGGKTRKAITEFLRTIPYRLLCTATAAPNDYIEFGTSAEALGELGYMDMLGRFFKHDSSGFHPGHGMFSRGNWRFRGHAEEEFWRWLCSWARAVRQPSDMGFSDERFKLPRLCVKQHVTYARTLADGMLFSLPAHSLQEQREERRRTLAERCEKAAEIAIAATGSVVCWCNLNDESHLLRKLIPDSVEVSGTDQDQRKEEYFQAFEERSARVLITKPTIGGFGLNWQHCSNQTFFPTHSFEQWYQAVRRCWRFGQKNEVFVDVVTSEGESRVLSNLLRKSEAAQKAFSRLVAMMNDALTLQRLSSFEVKEEIPSWL